MDIPIKTLANWTDAARAGRPVSSSQHRPVSELEAEVTRLPSENATLKMEREILKKRRRSSPKGPGEVRRHRS